MASFQQCIPHRPPFLFVDDVIEWTEYRIVATKTADPDAPYFAGHYPGNPVMPGVLICECVFQAGALLASKRCGLIESGPRTPVLTRIKDARFKRIVKPGEQLNIEVTFDDELSDAYFMTGRVTVDGAAVLRVEFACMMAIEE
jgi:3-hydroxyacyl-[acyl-carrier-protein] dehydratase